MQKILINFAALSDSLKFFPRFLSLKLPNQKFSSFPSRLHREANEELSRKRVSISSRATTQWRRYSSLGTSSNNSRNFVTSGPCLARTYLANNRKAAVREKLKVPADLCQPKPNLKVTKDPRGEPPSTSAHFDADQR